MAAHPPDTPSAVQAGAIEDRPSAEPKPKAQSRAVAAPKPGSRQLRLSFGLERYAAIPLARADLHPEIDRHIVPARLSVLANLPELSRSTPLFAPTRLIEELDALVFVGLPTDNLTRFQVISPAIEFLSAKTLLAKRKGVYIRVAVTSDEDGGLESSLRWLERSRALNIESPRSKRKRLNELKRERRHALFGKSPPAKHLAWLLGCSERTVRNISASEPRPPKSARKPHRKSK